MSSVCCHLAAETEMPAAALVGCAHTIAVGHRPHAHMQVTCRSSCHQMIIIPPVTCMPRCMPQCMPPRSCLSRNVPFLGKGSHMAAACNSIRLQVLMRSCGHGWLCYRYAYTSNRTRDAAMTAMPSSVKPMTSFLPGSYLQ